MDIDFIITFFATKSISMITAFVCWTPAQVVELSRCASVAGVRLSVQVDFHRLPEMAACATYREGILLDVTCPRAALVLDKASCNRAFNHRHSWLLLHNSSYDGSIVTATLGGSAILPDADAVWSSSDALVDVYRVHAARPYSLTTLRRGRGARGGSTRAELHALWAALPAPATRRKDLGGVSLKAAVVLTQPQHFRGWSELRDRQIDTYPKVTYPLIMLTTQDLHYRLNLVQVDAYGAARNGSFTGLAGLLQRARVELGVASMFMRADRTHVLHYCAETFTITGAFIYRQPGRSAVSNVFLLPFGGGVWAACGGVAALAALALPAMRRVLAGASHHHAALALLTLPDSCTFALGALCQQGFPVAPPVTSVRLVMFSALLMSLFVFTAYSAKVVALLQSPGVAIRSLDELARSPMQLAVQETTYKKVYFAESSDPATQQLFRRKLAPQGERAYRSVADGIALVRTGLYAFQTELSPGYEVVSRTFTEREKCALREVRAFRLPAAAVPLRKLSGYRDLFAARLRWQREAGLLARERRRWLADRPRCRAAAAAGFLSVGLIDVLPAIQVLGLGVGLAVLMLLAEISTHAFSNRQTP